MGSNPFLGAIITYDRCAPMPIMSNQQSMERKMPTTAKEMFHLTEAHKNDNFMVTASNIKEKIDRSARHGELCCGVPFPRRYSLLEKVKEHFRELGFDVSQDTDKDGDPRLWFCWENAKDAQPSA